MINQCTFEEFIESNTKNNKRYLYNMQKSNVERCLYNLYIRYNIN